MPFRPWSNGFASGLIVGIFLTILVGLSFERARDSFETQRQDVGHDSSQPYSNGNNTSSDQEGMFWGWRGPFITSADTLAQWVMMAFTVVAAGLLWWTLLVSRQVGIAQTRAYLHVKQAELRWLSRLGQFPEMQHQDVFNITLTVENTGSTPALWYEVEGRCRVQDRVENSPTRTLFDVEVKPLRWGILTGGASLTCPFQNAAMLPLFVEAGTILNSYLRIDGVVRYRTEFKETLEVPFAFYVEGVEIASYWHGTVDYGEWRKRRIKMTRPTQGQNED